MDLVGLTGTGPALILLRCFFGEVLDIIILSILPPRSQPATLLVVRGLRSWILLNLFHDLSEHLERVYDAWEVLDQHSAPLLGQLAEGHHRSLSHSLAVNLATS